MDSATLFALGVGCVLVLGCMTVIGLKVLKRFNPKNLRRLKRKATHALCLLLCSYACCCVAMLHARLVYLLHAARLSSVHSPAE